VDKKKECYYILIYSYNAMELNKIRNLPKKSINIESVGDGIYTWRGRGLK
jgi:hypothetical protein